MGAVTVRTWAYGCLRVTLHLPSLQSAGSGASQVAAKPRVSLLLTACRLPLTQNISPGFPACPVLEVDPWLSTGHRARTKLRPRGPLAV